MRWRAREFQADDPAYSVTVSRTSSARYWSCCRTIPEGIVWDWPGDTEVILARKRG
jgi:hypothetical protein